MIIIDINNNIYFSEELNNLKINHKYITKDIIYINNGMLSKSIYVNTMDCKIFYILIPFR